MTPYTSSSSPQQVDEVQFSDDKNFALHGKIMLVVLVIVFSLFILFILMVPCLKMRARRLSHESETSDGGGADSIAGLHKVPSPCSRFLSRRRKEDLTPDTN